MGKVTMEGTGNPELASDEHEGAKDESLPVESGPKNGETRDVQEEKKHAGKRNVNGSTHKF